MSNGTTSTTTTTRQMLQTFGDKVYDISGGRGNEQLIGTAQHSGMPVFQTGYETGDGTQLRQIYGFTPEGGDVQYYQRFIDDAGGGAQSSAARDLMFQGKAEFLSTAGSGFDPEIMQRQGFSKLELSDAEMADLTEMGSGYKYSSNYGLSSRGEQLSGKDFDRTHRDEYGHFQPSWQSPSYFQTERFLSQHPHPQTTWQGSEKGYVGYKGEYPGPDFMKGKSAGEIYQGGIESVVSKISDNRVADFIKGSMDKAIVGLEGLGKEIERQLEPGTYFSDMERGDLPNWARIQIGDNERAKRKAEIAARKKSGNP